MLKQFGMIYLMMVALPRLLLLLEKELRLYLFDQAFPP